MLCFFYEYLMNRSVPLGTRAKLYKISCDPFHQSSHVNLTQKMFLCLSDCQFITENHWKSIFIHPPDLKKCPISHIVKTLHRIQTEQSILLLF